MKKTIFRILPITLVAFLMSCEGDDGTGYQNHGRDFSPVNATVEISDAVVAEGDQGMIPITVNVDREAPFKTRYYVTYGGTAVRGVDYTAPSYIEVSEYSTSATDYITLLTDCVTEEDENITITLGDNTTGNVNVSAASANITVENYVSPTLDFTVTWGEPDVPFVVDGTVVNIDACDIADMDVFIHYNGVSIGNNDGATTACTEALSFNPQDAADGTYELVVNAYEYKTIFDDADITNFDYSFNFAVTSDICGVTNENVETLNGPVHPVTTFNLSDGAGETITIGTFTVENGVVTNVTYN